MYRSFRMSSRIILTLKSSAFKYQLRELATAGVHFHHDFHLGFDDRLQTYEKETAATFKLLRSVLDADVTDITKLKEIRQTLNDARKKLLQES